MTVTIAVAKPLVSSVEGLLETVDVLADIPAGRTLTLTVSRRIGVSAATGGLLVVTRKLGICAATSRTVVAVCCTSSTAPAPRSRPSKAVKAPVTDDAERIVKLSPVLGK